MCDVLDRVSRIRSSELFFYFVTLFIALFVEFRSSRECMKSRRETRQERKREKFVLMTTMNTNAISRRRKRCLNSDRRRRNFFAIRTHQDIDSITIILRCLIFCLLLRKSSLLQRIAIEKMSSSTSSRVSVENMSFSSVNRGKKKKKYRKRLTILRVVETNLLVMSTLTTRDRLNHHMIMISEEELSIERD